MSSVVFRNKNSKIITRLSVVLEIGAIFIQYWAFNNNRECSETKKKFVLENFKKCMRGTECFPF
jgi:hypothetical protein